MPTARNESKIGRESPLCAFRPRQPPPPQNSIIGNRPTRRGHVVCVHGCQALNPRGKAARISRQDYVEGSLVESSQSPSYLTRAEFLVGWGVSGCTGKSRPLAEIVSFAAETETDREGWSYPVMSNCAGFCRVRMDDAVSSLELRLPGKRAKERRELLGSCPSPPP